MHDAGVDACDPHALDGICEAAELQVEVERLGAVGRGEMRERADLVERAVEGDLAGEFDGLVTPMRFMPVLSARWYGARIPCASASSA